MKIRHFRIFGFLFLSMVAWLYAQKPDFAIRVDASLVSLEATVQDENGRQVTRLTQEDFSVYEDGKLQRISHFMPVEAPRSILLLLDKFVANPFVIDAMNSFLRTLHPQDRIAVAAFDRDVRMALDWRQAQNGIPLAIQIPKFPIRPQFQPTTNVYSSLERATQLFRNEKGRKVVLILTNGYDEEVMRQWLKIGEALDIANDRDFNKHMETIKRAEIPLYFVALYSDRNGGIDTLNRNWFLGSREAMSAFLAGARLRLEKLAEITGGRIYFPVYAEDLVPLYSQIGLDLSGTYGLAYNPTNTLLTGMPRRIEVRVRDKRLTVIQSRVEYTAK